MSNFRDLQCLKNLDDEFTLKELEQSILDPKSSNFAVCFDDNEALGGSNISKDELSQFLDAKKFPRQNEFPVSPSITRWINLWTPNEQRESLDLLAKRYDFSARLLALMRTDPPPLKEMTVATQKDHSSWTESFKRRGDDCEHHAADTVPLEEREPIADQALNLNHYDIVREIWHFFSADFGPKYVCIGYNSLYNTGGSRTSKQQRPSKDRSKPAGTRAWTWLVLCNDSTIISIHENFSKRFQPQDLAIMRRHIKQVLRRLSKPANPTRADNPIMTLTLRRAVEPEIIEPLQAAESSSLLFYYLFDDWYTSYSLVARKDHQYGAKLESLRSEMFENAAKLEEVNRLHQYGRQLSVLKKIYQSYDRIIQRILERQKTVVKEERPEQHGLSEVTTLNPLGIPLHSSAIVRFQALRDRINLFPLSEIDECLCEKDALVQVSFNLISLKEASFVDRLTRITILLAKATILFLPVSLMTAYFTIPLAGNNAEYTAKQYWIAFAVLIAVSYAVLLLFGYLSGTQDTKTIYESLTSIFYKKVTEKSDRGTEEKAKLYDKE